MTLRRGASLAEVVLVAWLFALVLGAVGRFAAAQARLSAAQHDRARAAEALRTASLILEAELRYLAASDVAVAAAESVRIRAVRGGGVVCRSHGATLLIRYRGVRLPDPRKDSVTLITSRDPASATPLGVAAVAHDTACGGSLRLTLDAAPAEPAAVALVHEAGAYHLSGGAVRYRIGGGGRQPLTEAVFGHTAFETDGSGRSLSLSLALHPDSLPRLGPLGNRIPLHTLNPWRVP